jgi:hypothetical protein
MNEAALAIGHNKVHSSAHCEILSVKQDAHLLPIKIWIHLLQVQILLKLYER